jgi:predicted dehydrogenase
MKRRALLKAAIGPLAFGHILGGPFVVGQEAGVPVKGKWRVGVIGHTGRGDYGHGIDTVWLKTTGAQIVAVADANADGLQAARKRLSVDRGYESYREMLSTTRPNVVAVCPRHPDQHHDMIMAAINAGAEAIYIEKPFCRSLVEADAMQKACVAHDIKLAVAHRNRYHPTLAVIDQMIKDGMLGRVLEIRGRGKGDRRGGAEDLWVLGSHVLNLIHYFGGSPQSCSATILQDGALALPTQIHPGNEALGPLLGNELHGRFWMERGFVAYFDSIANDDTKNAGFGLQIIGSRGVVDINCDRNPLAYFVPGNPFQPTSEPRPWTAISSQGVEKPETQNELLDQVAHHHEPVRDLLDCVGVERQPKCGVADATTTVEMISAIFASHMASGKAVLMPLQEREHPLT